MTATISSSKTCTLCPRRNNPRKKFRKFFGRGSPSDTENLSNQPTIHNGRPSKGVCFLFVPEQTSRKGHICPPCATLRHIYTPFPRYSWCSFVSPSGFLRPIPNFTKYFLQQRNFFSKMWRANYGASRASLGGWVGGGVSFCVSLSTCAVRPPVGLACVRPWACPPAKNRPSVRPCGRFERLRLVRPVLGWFYMPVCVPCQDGDKGRKFSSQIFKPVPVLSCPSLEDDNRQQDTKKETAFCMVVSSWVVWCFSLVLKHCERVSFAVGYLDLSGGFVLLYACCGRACNII